ncbi:MAG: hypothetical protein R3B54_09440 [Bdellovibrionota bacterium]
MELRNLLKFDFFFNPTLEFRRSYPLTGYFLRQLKETARAFPPLLPKFEKLQDMTVYTSGPGYLLESYLVVDAIEK